MRLFVKITSLCIFVAKDISPNAKDLRPKELSKFQSQSDCRETNSSIIFIIKLYYSLWNRINKARNSYCSLRNIWKSNVHSLKTKELLFNINVISVLLYGCQTWRVNKNDMNMLDVFQTKCLRRIYNIFWPNKISNKDLYRRTNSLPISCHIQKHGLRWLGHVLRMSPDHIPKVAL